MAERQGGRAARRAVGEAVEFAADFMADQILLRVFRRGSEYAGACLIPLHDDGLPSDSGPMDDLLHSDDPSEPDIRTDEYVWSGPYSPE